MFVALLQVLVYGLGGIINVGNPEISPPERATIWASLHMLPTVLEATALAAALVFNVVPKLFTYVGVLELPVLLTVYYVLPYQRATGTLAPGGSLDWATGEMALMVSWRFIWIALGIFAIRYILKAYAPTGGAPAIFERL